MKKLILMIVFILSSCTKSSLPTPKNKQNQEVGVYLDYKDTENIYSVSERYRLKDDKCQISWTVMTNKKSLKLGLVLRYMDYLSKEKGCENFSSQVDAHQKILTNIFNKYDTSRFTWLRTPGMRSINPSGEWNKKIKEISEKNTEWVDYTKNYPNHKSGKSSNGLLKEELTKNFHIIKEFTDLFLPTFTIKLSHVEKVMTEKMNKQSVFFDAGVFEFEVVRIIK